MPRTGHFRQLLNVFNYLSNHDRSWLAFDTTKLNLKNNYKLEDDPWKRQDMLKEQYPEAVEKLPDKFPTPRGKSIQINAFVDTDHAGDVVTRRSQTGIIIFL